MKPRLLLLEDEPTSRMFLAAALADLAVEVDLAENIAQGREVAARGGHALWLFDSNLPDGTGSALLAALRSEGLSTPAIVHTAAVGEEERARLLDDGFDAVVIKPLPAAAWLAAVQAALERAPAQPVAEEAAHYPIGDTPVWDDGAAAAALAGNRDNVHALRQLFLAELPAARDHIVAAVSYGDEAGVREGLHRLRASCGFVGAARLDAAGRALRDDPGSAARLKDFVDAANATAG